MDISISMRVDHLENIVLDNWATENRMPNNASEGMCIRNGKQSKASPWSHQRAPSDTLRRRPNTAHGLPLGDASRTLHAAPNRALKGIGPHAAAVAMGIVNRHHAPDSPHTGTTRGQERAEFGDLAKTNPGSQTCSTDEASSQLTACMMR